MIGAMPNYHMELETLSAHRFDLPRMCPVSGNPQPGSRITVEYTARALFLEIESMGEYIASYIGGRPIGRDLIRDMEQTIQQIAIDCAKVVEVPVTVTADLVIADDPETRTRMRDYRLIVSALC